MNLSPYRRVLSLPRVPTLLLVGFLARIPATAVGLALTLHVVNTLHRSYGAAGLITAGYTVGAAFSGPPVGRMIDRHGARPVLAVTALAQAVCWFTVPWLPYAALCVLAVVAGLLVVPVWGLVRQAVSALVPASSRRPAFALDSMSVEMSFMIGPAAAVAMATTVSTRLTIIVIGVGILLAAGLLFALNPPMRPAGADTAVRPAPRRDWLGPRLVAVLVATVGATVVLSGTDLIIVADLRLDKALSMTGIVIALWCAYSLSGGLVFGALRRSVPMLAIVAALPAFTVPLGLAPTWQVLCVALIPAGVLCAPTIASANDVISRLVPAQSRGEALGMHSSALTIGTSLGAPFAGLIIDHVGPHWAFATTGLAGLLLVAAAVPAWMRAPRASAAAGPRHEAPPALALSEAA